MRVLLQVITIAHPLLNLVGAEIALATHQEAVIGVAEEPQLIEQQPLEKEKDNTPLLSPEEAMDRSKAYGVRQLLEDCVELEQEQMVERLLEVDSYMYETVFQDETYKEVKERCRNRHKLCTFWAAVGECEESAEGWTYMSLNCAPACYICDKLDLEAAVLEEEEADGDDASSSDVEVIILSDEKQDDLMSAEDPIERSLAYGKRQDVEGKEEEVTLKRLLEVETYMREKVFRDDSFRKVKKHCRNRNKDCTFWAATGECEESSEYMTLNCAPACFTCEQLDFDFRCPFNESLPDIWKAGDLNRLFERITSDPYYQQYNLTILSSPKLNDGPWVVTLDNFLSEHESQTLIELGASKGYKRSAGFGEVRDDGTWDSEVTESRTSSNTWCDGACSENSTTQEVLARIENLTGIPDANSEELQLLKYEKGEYYWSHHDYIDYHLERNQGVRILTLFMYLNDVEAGGGTRFTDLGDGLVVKPKRGKAVIWPSVMNNDPNQIDERTHHEAMPVIEGVKYGANAWIHQRDFKTPLADGCI